MPQTNYTDAELQELLDSLDDIAVLGTEHARRLILELGEARRERDKFAELLREIGISMQEDSASVDLWDKQGRIVSALEAHYGPGWEGR